MTTLVSVRLPKSLVDEFKETSSKDHFLDVSEAVRSVIREEWVRQKDPVAYQVQKLRNEISKTIESRGQAEVLDELKKIRERLQ